MPFVIPTLGGILANRRRNWLLAKIPPNVGMTKGIKKQANKKQKTASRNLLPHCFYARYGQAAGAVVANVEGRLAVDRGAQFQQG